LCGVPQRGGRGVQTCDTTTGRSDTCESEGEGGCKSANRTRGNGINGQECGDAARARRATFSDHRRKGTNIEHDHRALFVANRRGEGWLWSGGARLDQTRVARHVEVRLCGASTCWLSASLTRWRLQVGADGLGLTAQGAKRAEE
jgi:hypothetical protein